MHLKCIRILISCSYLKISTIKYYFKSFSAHLKTSQENDKEWIKENYENPTFENENHDQ